MTWHSPPMNLFSPRTVSRIATWNVKTMYETGKTAQVTREMQRYRLDILGLAETRWTNSGKVTLATGETLIYSGPTGEKAPHRDGVGLMLTHSSLETL